jgi:hypothetical protein
MTGYKLYYARYSEKGETYSENVSALNIKQAREVLKERRPTMDRIVSIGLCSNKRNHM